jgi:hypothetical protein
MQGNATPYPITLGWPPIANQPWWVKLYYKELLFAAEYACVAAVGPYPCKRLSITRRQNAANHICVLSDQHRFRDACARTLTLPM